MSERARLLQGLGASIRARREELALMASREMGKPLADSGAEVEGVTHVFGLIKWKMELELGESFDTPFGNPDFVAYAGSFGARGYRIESADELLPTLRRALAEDTVSVIGCPVDYSANLQLTNALGELDESLA